MAKRRRRAVAKAVAGVAFRLIPAPYAALWVRDASSRRRCSAPSGPTVLAFPPPRSIVGPAECAARIGKPQKSHRWMAAAKADALELRSSTIGVGGRLHH